MAAAVIIAVFGAVRYSATEKKRWSAIPGLMSGTIFAYGLAYALGAVATAGIATGLWELLKRLAAGDARLFVTFSVPAVIAALNPIYAFDFFAANPGAAFLAMGAVVLVVTGTEALYADMGRFGPQPIRITWYGLVLPTLLLNYAGQTAVVVDGEVVKVWFGGGDVASPDENLHGQIGFATLTK